jgi:transcription elongation factor Elf1
MMNDWHPPVECPKCGSEETHFVEPNYEMSIYECDVCGCRFEREED